MVCHDRSFAEAEAAEGFAAANPGLAVIREQTPAEIVAAATGKAGRVDVLVCNDAGAAIRAPIETASVDDMRSALDEMVVFPFLLAGAVVPQMKQRRQGKILFITSATPLRGLPNYSIYVTARGAANALAVSLAQELGRDNIQVNAIAPNYVESPTYFPARAGGRPRGARQDDPEHSAEAPRQAGRGRGPGGVLHASDRSDFITGHVMPFAGGWA